MGKGKGKWRRRKRSGEVGKWGVWIEVGEGHLNKEILECLNFLIIKTNSTFNFFILYFILVISREKKE